MAANTIFGENTDFFAVLGAVAASYIAIQLICSVWCGLKAYVLGKSLGLAANLKKMGQWAGKPQLDMFKHNLYRNKKTERFLHKLPPSKFQWGFMAQNMCHNQRHRLL